MGKYLPFSYTKQESKLKKQLLSFALVLALVLAMVVPASASGSEWYLEYADADGIYYNRDSGGIKISFSHGMIVLSYTSFYFEYTYDYKNVSEKDGIYVYTSEEDGTEMRYDPSDGSICLEGDEYTYMPLTKHGAQYELPADFDENWCRTPVAFSQDGLELTVSMADDGSIRFDSEYYQGSVDGSEYEAASFDGVYYTDHDKYEIYYFPKDGILVLLENGWSSMFYEVDAAVMNEPVDDPEQYGLCIMDSVWAGDDLTVHVYAPYWTQGTDLLGSYTNIRVFCSVENVSGGNLVFNASEHFSLNNNGIIEYGSCEYDFTTIAPWTTFVTFIDFSYRMSSVNINYDLMTMTVDGTDISLTLRPQTPEAYDSIEGVYCKGDSYRLYIEDLGGGEIIVTETVGVPLISGLNSLKNRRTVLDESNAFDFDGIEYYWHPSEHTIECPFSGFTFIKQ